jgi:hypothetical protein
LAIKGRTRRSRPARRPATAPRIQSVERRQPWYRATVFPVTLAVITLLVTLLASWNRLEQGWARDDVQRFTAKLRVQTDQLAAITGAGITQAPGFSSAANLAKGTLKPKDLAARAATWQTRIQAIGSQVASITVGKLPTTTSSNGDPSNSVGGRVPMLSSVRDAYVAAIGFYAQAAATYQQAASTSDKALAQKLVTVGDGDAQGGGAAIDAAAGMLARLFARYDLDAKLLMPGESSNAYSARYSPSSSSNITTNS